jgi:hypothetical protein
VSWDLVFGDAELGEGREIGIGVGRAHGEVWKLLAGSGTG